MTWVAWRQVRDAGLMAAAALIALGIFVLLTGIHLHSEFSAHQSQFDDCVGLGTGRCDQAALGRVPHYKEILATLNLVTLVTPAFFGTMCGVPLIASEMERGTYRLAWTQSISRERWLWAKLAVAGGAVVVGSGLLSLMVTWWASPFDANMNTRFDEAIFSTRGLVPIGYATLAFAIGLLLGVVSRRSAIAIPIAVPAFIALSIFSAGHIRPHLVPAHVTVQSLKQSVASNGISYGVGARAGFIAVGSYQIPGGLLVSGRLINPENQTLSHAQLEQLVSTECTGVDSPSTFPGVQKPSSGSGLSGCVDKLNSSVRVQIRSIPPSEYWRLQWTEFLLYLAAAAALVGVSFAWIRYRFN